MLRGGRYLHFLTDEGRQEQSLLETPSSHCRCCRRARGWRVCFASLAAMLLTALAWSLVGPWRQLSAGPAVASSVFLPAVCVAMGELTHGLTSSWPCHSRALYTPVMARCPPCCHLCQLCGRRSWSAGAVCTPSTSDGLVPSMPM